MRLADQYLLAQIREKLLSHIPDDQWKLVEEEVDKAGGVREVGGYTGVLLTDAISKASFGGDRSAAGRYAAEQRWKGHEKGGAKYLGLGGKSEADYLGLGTGMEVRSMGASQQKLEDIKSADLSDLAGMIVRDLKAQGKQVPAAAKPYLEAMRTMGSINENYGMDTGASIVGYLLSNLASYKGETARAIKAELKSRLKNQKLSDMEPLPSASTGATATDMYGRTQEIRSEPKGKTSLDEDDFADKKAFANRKGSETYKKVVETTKTEIKRNADGVARYRGQTLVSLRQSLEAEKEMLRSFESRERSATKILGSPFKRSDATAILQARVASAEARVQAMEEFEDESSPGFLSS